MRQPLRQYVSDSNNPAYREARTRQLLDALHQLLVQLPVLAEVAQRESLGPGVLLEVEQHALLGFGLPVGDADGVVMAVEAVDKGLKGASGGAGLCLAENSVACSSAECK